MMRVLGRRVAGCASVVLLAASLTSGQIIYVDANKDPNQAVDGSSWPTAYPTLDAALDAAGPTSEIRIANGTYTPSTDGLTNPPRDATFRLDASLNGVRIYGGYAGFGAPDPDARDIDANETVLSGDLDRDDWCSNPGTDSNCCVAGDEKKRAGCQDENSSDPEWCEDIVAAHEWSLQQTTYCRNWAWFPECVAWAAELCFCLCPSDRDYTIENSYHVVTTTGVGTSTLLDGLTITGGNANAPPPPPDATETRRNGGGLYSLDSSPTLQNCTFRDNFAAADGGAVYVFGGTPVLSGSQCKFQNNDAGYRGGGMFIENGGLSAGDCQFTENSAGDQGGGVWATGGNVSLTNCSLSANIAGESVSSGQGGGLFLLSASAQVTLTGCDFVYNSAADGGGAYHLGVTIPAVPSQLTLAQCDFQGNGANDGAGMFVSTNTVATFTDCTFDQNRSRSAGSGALGGGGLLLLDGSEATLNGCTFTGNEAEAGGGLAAVRSDVTLSNCPFLGNQAGYGGAIYLFADGFGHSSATVSNCNSPVGCTDQCCAIDGNIASSNGGAIWSNSGSVTIDQVAFRNCKALGGSGGALGADDDGTLTPSITLLESTFEFNYAEYGGALYVIDGPNLLVDGCTIANNGRNGSAVTIDGGGVYVRGHASTLMDIVGSTIRNNEALGGGGVTISASTDPWNPTYLGLLDSTVEANQALFPGGNGGGINSSENGVPIIVRSRIVSNTAERDGGGVFLFAWPTVHRPTGSPPYSIPSPAAMAIANSLIAGNNAADDGGGIWQAGGYLEIVGSTIADNTATRYGGGLWGNYFLDLYAYNSVFWDNSVAGAGDGPQLGVPGNSLLWACDVQEGGVDGGQGIRTQIYDPNDPDAVQGALDWKDNSIVLDPLFVDRDGLDDDPATWDDNDFRLAVSPETSPCIDRGDDRAVWGAYDLDLGPRILGCTVDMGASEREGLPPLLAMALDDVHGPKNRYISFQPTNPGRETAVRVTMTQSQDYAGSVGSQWWVREPQNVSEFAGDSGSTPPTFRRATLDCEAYYMDWGTDTVHISGAEIVPLAEYKIETIARGCNPADAANYAVLPQVWTTRWGKIVGELSSGLWQPAAAGPDEEVEGRGWEELVSILDVVAALDKFRNATTAISKVRADLRGVQVPAQADAKVDIVDALSSLDGFRSRRYPDSFPTAGPQLECSAVGECVVDIRADIDGDGDIDGFDEIAEETRALLLRVNSDDDDRNGVHDSAEAPVIDENDLRELRLLADTCLPDVPGNASWSIATTPDSLSVWLHPDKSSDGTGTLPGDSLGNGLSYPWPPPVAVWLEATETITNGQVLFSIDTGSTASVAAVSSAVLSVEVPCTPALERYWIRANQVGSVTGAEAVIDATRSQMTPLCAEGTAVSDGGSSIWLEVDRFPLEPEVWMQLGYLRETQLGAIAAIETVYTEMNWGPTLDEWILTEHLDLDFGSHRLTLFQLSAPCGCWGFFYDGLQIDSMAHPYWQDVTGTRAAWAAEIQNLEDRLCGNAAQPCVFSSCALVNDWGSGFPAALVPGDIIFHPPSPGDAEWGKELLSPTSFKVWDRNP